MGLRAGRIGSWLALLAFVAQLVLAIGHIELPGSLHQSGWVQQALSHLLEGADHSTHDQGKPNHQDGRGDSCPICILKAVAGSLVLPSTAAIVVATLGDPITWPAVAGVRPHTLDGAYRIRAPPARTTT